MIKQHSSFEKVTDETILWQYMSLAKLLFLIKNRRLHLHRIDDFMDKEEGVLSVLDKRSLPFYENTQGWNDYLEDDRKRTFISCWIKYPIEQSLMWYAYGKDGVAIRSTAGAISRAMEIDTKHQVNMMPVIYHISKVCFRVTNKRPNSFTDPQYFAFPQIFDFPVFPRFTFIYGRIALIFQNMKVFTTFFCNFALL